MVPLLINSSVTAGFNRVLSYGIPDIASEALISNDS